MFIDLSFVLNFDDFFVVDGYFQGCVWGVFDKDGKKDYYGILNFVIFEIVVVVVKEVIDGIFIFFKYVCGFFM